MKSQTRHHLSVHAALATLALTLTGCSRPAQTLASTGENLTVSIPPGTQFVSMNWSQYDLWVLYFDPKSNKCVFARSTSQGMLEAGGVTVPNCNPVALVKSMPPMASR